MTIPTTLHHSRVNVVQSRAEMFQPDFNIIFLGGGGGIFLVSIALKSLILKLDKTKTIFLNSFFKILALVIGSTLRYLFLVW